MDQILIYEILDTIEQINKISAEFSLVYAYGLKSYEELPDVIKKEMKKAGITYTKSHKASDRINKEDDMIFIIPELKLTIKIK